MYSRVRAALGTFALVALCGAPLPAPAALVELTNLFVFGDSLSDGGNSGLLSQRFAGPGVVFPPPPYYFGGRYSNGLTAVEYLWNSYNPGNMGFKPSLAGGTNYAIGGATTGSANLNEVNAAYVPSDLRPAYAGFGNAWQLQTFAGAPAFDPATSLFVVWLFPNDAFYANQTGELPGSITGSPAPNVVANGIANILTTIQILAAAGAQHFLVPNTPDLGEAPAFRETMQGDALSNLTALFNTNLKIQLDLLDQLLSADIVQFDTAAAFDAVLKNPAAYGFTNTTESCVANLANGRCSPDTWDTWLFWDEVHPTTATHRLLGTQFRAALPEPPSLWLLAAALLALAWLGRAARARP